MDQTTLQAMNAIRQILEGLSVENKLMALGAVSALRDRQSSHGPRREE